MNQKVFCACAALLVLSGCANLPQPPAAEPASYSAATTAELYNGIAVDAEISAEAIPTMAAPVSSVSSLPKDVIAVMSAGNADCSLTLRSQGGSHSIDVTEDLLKGLWEEMLQQDYTLLDEQAPPLRDGASSIRIQLGGTDSFYLLTVYAGMDCEPAVNDKTFLDIEHHGDEEVLYGSFSSGSGLFARMLALLSSMEGGRGHVELPVDSITLKSAYNLDELQKSGFRVADFLQTSGRVVWRLEDKNGASSRIEIFDAATGESLWNTIINEPVERMERSRIENGYDFRIFTPTRTLYKNSKNFSKQKAYTLPPSVSLIPWSSENGHGGFDLSRERIAWASSEGIYLADLQGNNQNLVLPNSRISELIGSRTYPGQNGAPYFVRPRLMNEDTQVVAPVVMPGYSASMIGFVVADVETGETSGHFDVFDGSYAAIAYPDQRTVAAASSESLTLLNLSHMESESLPLPTGIREQDGKQRRFSWLTDNYKTFLISDAGTGTDGTDLKLSVQKLSGTKREVFSLQSSGAFEMSAITSSYALGRIYDMDGLRYAIFPYG